MFATCILVVERGTWDWVVMSSDNEEETRTKPSKPFIHYMGSLIRNFNFPLAGFETNHAALDLQVALSQFASQLDVRKT